LRYCYEICFEGLREIIIIIIIIIYYYYYYYYYNNLYPTTSPDYGDEDNKGNTWKDA